MQYLEQMYSKKVIYYFPEIKIYLVYICPPSWTPLPPPSPSHDKTTTILQSN